MKRACSRYGSRVFEYLAEEQENRVHLPNPLCTVFPTVTRLMGVWGSTCATWWLFDIHSAAPSILWVQPPESKSSTASASCPSTSSMRRWLMPSSPSSSQWPGVSASLGLVLLPLSGICPSPFLPHPSYSPSSIEVHCWQKTNICSILAKSWPSEKPKMTFKMSKLFRLFALMAKIRCLSGPDVWATRRILAHCYLGDWFVLYQVTWLSKMKH